jgi:hypothetical protein
MYVQEIINQINEFRKQKNYIESDKLRNLLIKSRTKIKLKDGIVILDTEIRLKKCSFCKKEVDRLNWCLIRKEFPRVYGRPPDYFLRYPEFCKERGIEPEHIVWEVMQIHNLYLCNECTNKPYILKHSKLIYTPIYTKILLEELE